MAGMRTTLILIPFAAAAVLLGACGESGGDNASAASSDPEQAQLQFAKCMREHGIAMEDPKPAAGGGPSRVTFKSKVGDGGPQKLDAAQRACQKYMRAAAPDLSPEEEQKMRDGALKFARCMRASGIDVPDPTFEDGGGIKIRVGGPGKGGDPGDNPRFEAAQRKCQKLMPKPPGGPGGAEKSVDGP
jgi:hypothetical protein